MTLLTPETVLTHSSCIDTKGVYKPFVEIYVGNKNLPLDQKRYKYMVSNKIHHLARDKKGLVVLEISKINNEKICAVPVFLEESNVDLSVQGLNDPTKLDDQQYFQYCFVAGWGAVNIQIEGEPGAVFEYSKKLRYIKVHVMEEKECNKILKDEKGIQNTDIFCAKSLGMQTGPLGSYKDIKIKELGHGVGYPSVGDIGDPLICRQKQGRTDYIIAGFVEIVHFDLKGRPYFVFALRGVSPGGVGSVVRKVLGMR